ncbi:hypothetical protein KIPB_007962, partial [Kipferlia bialata]
VFVLSGVAWLILAWAARFSPILDYVSTDVYSMTVEEAQQLTVVVNGYSAYRCVVSVTKTGDTDTFWLLDDPRGKVNSSATQVAAFCADYTVGQQVSLKAYPYSFCKATIPDLESDTPCAFTEEQIDDVASSRTKGRVWGALLLILALVILLSVMNCMGAFKAIGDKLQSMSPPPSQTQSSTVINSHPHPHPHVAVLPVQTPPPVAEASSSDDGFRGPPAPTSDTVERGEREVVPSPPQPNVPEPMPIMPVHTTSADDEFF